MNLQPLTRVCHTSRPMSAVIRFYTTVNVDLSSTLEHSALVAYWRIRSGPFLLVSPPCCWLLQMLLTIFTTSSCSCRFWVILDMQTLWCWFHVFCLPSSTPTSWFIPVNTDTGFLPPILYCTITGYHFSVLTVCATLYWCMNKVKFWIWLTRNSLRGESCRENVWASNFIRSAKDWWIWKTLGGEKGNVS